MRFRSASETAPVSSLRSCGDFIDLLKSSKILTESPLKSKKYLFILNNRLIFHLRGCSVNSRETHLTK